MKRVLIVASATSAASALLGLTAWSGLRAFKRRRFAQQARSMAELAEFARQESKIVKRIEKSAIEAANLAQEAQNQVTQADHLQEPAQAEPAPAAGNEEAQVSEEDARVPNASLAAGNEKSSRFTQNQKPCQAVDITQAPKPIQAQCPTQLQPEQRPGTSGSKKITPKIGKKRLKATQTGPFQPMETIIEEETGDKNQSKPGDSLILARKTTTHSISMEACAKGELASKAAKADKVKSATSLPDSRLVKEVIPGLYLAATKDPESFSEDLLKQWGFSLAVATSSRDAINKESLGVKKLFFNTSDRLLAQDLDSLFLPLYSSCKEAWHAGRKVLFIPSNYTIAWLLAILMKESKLSSSEAKQKLKATTGTKFRHGAFNRKIAEFGAHMGVSRRKKILALEWRGGHRVFVDCKRGLALLANGSTSAYIIQDKGKQYLWLGEKASRADTTQAVHTGRMFNRFNGLTTATFREGKDVSQKKLVELLYLENSPDYFGLKQL